MEFITLVFDAGEEVETDVHPGIQVFHVFRLQGDQLAVGDENEGRSAIVGVEIVVMDLRGQAAST